METVSTCLEECAWRDISMICLTGNIWTKLEASFEPPPRLDHTLTTIKLNRKQASSSASLDEAAQKTSTDDNMDTYLLLFGGMDTAGLIFDDFFLLKIS